MRSCLNNLERSLMIIPVRSHEQDLGLKTSMILQDFVCKITTDFGTISGEIMPDKSCMTFCDGLCKILQDLSGKTLPDIVPKSVVILHVRMCKIMEEISCTICQTRS